MGIHFDVAEWLDVMRRLDMRPKNFNLGVFGHADGATLARLFLSRGVIAVERVLAWLLWGKEIGHPRRRWRNGLLHQWWRGNRR